MKLILVHSSVADDQLLLASFKTDCLIRRASKYADAASLLGSLEALDIISSIAFIYKSNGLCDLPFFMDAAPSEYAFFNQEIVALIRELRIHNTGLTVDILTCNLNMPEFIETVSKLEVDLDVDIRYSLDQTGNNPDGNWVLESDAVDIKNLYFSDLIDMWTDVLDIVQGGAGVSGTAVNAVAYDNTYVYVGGSFTVVNGVQRNYLCRYFKDGALDTAWNPNIDGVSTIYVQTIVVDSTYVYIGGSFTTVGGSSRPSLARIVKSTGVADSWIPIISSASPVINSIVLDSANSHVYVGGQFAITQSSITRNNIARLSTSTANADSWNPNVSSASAVVNTLVLDSANSCIYIGGSFTQLAGTTTRNNVARVSTSTGVADSWDPNVSSASAVVNALALDSANSCIYIGGTFTQLAGTTTRNNVARVSTSTGAVDTWDPNVNNTVRSITQNDTYIYIGGDFTTTNIAVTRNRIARFAKSDTTGTIDSTWFLNTNNYVASIVLDSNMLYIGGGFNATTIPAANNGIALTYRFFMYNLLTSNSTMPSLKGFNFSFSTNAVFATLCIDNYIYVAGNFSRSNNLAKVRIARFSKTTGILDTEWGPAINNTVRTITHDDTYIYIGGVFTTVDGVTRNRVARFVRSTGALDSWDPNVSGGTTPYVYAVVSDNTNVYIGGAMTTVGTGADTYTRNGIARVSASTGIADSWDPNISSNTVFAIALDSVNGFVYVGGSFISVNGGTTTRNRLARFPNSSSTVNGWNPNVSGTGAIVYKIVVDNTNNLLYIGGSFGTISGTTRRNAAQYTLGSGTSGSLNAWHPSMNSTVWDIALDGSNVYLGGDFTQYGVGGTVVTRNRVARMSNTTTEAVLDSWNPSINNTVYRISVDGSNIYLGGGFNVIDNAAASDLYGNVSLFTMTNSYITNSRATLTTHGITDQSAITSKSINQGDIVTDNFVDFTEPTVSANKAAVRHALLSLLQEYNFNSTKFYMPRANLGLTGSGNVLVQTPYNNINVSDITASNPIYANLYVTDDYVTVTVGGSTKTITKTASGYLYDGVTYTEGQTVTVALNYTITFGGVYITQNDILIVEPDAPGLLTAVPGYASASLSWYPPTSDGNSPITSYTVTSVPDNITVTTTDTTATITGLKIGKSYMFNVYATNIAGNSGLSETLDPVIIEASPTLAPPTLKALTTGSDLIGYTLVVCTTPNTNAVGARYFELTDGIVGTSATVEALFGYTPNSASNSNRASFVASQTVGGTLIRADATTYTTVVSRLHITTAYIESTTSIKVNSYYYDNNTLTEITLSTNTLTTDSSLLDKLKYFWLGRTTYISSPYYNGNLSQVAIYPGDLSANSPTTTLLPLIQAPSANTYDDNTYIFNAVSGFNGVTVQRFGTTTASSSSITLDPTGYGYLNMMNITVVAPSPPTSPSVSYTQGQTSASVSFTAPSSNGGADITSYTVTAISSDGGATQTESGSASPITISGLTIGKTYTFTVTATNSVGTSSASTATSPVTYIITAPDAPSAPTTESGDKNIIVSWIAPYNGGNTITDYKIRYSTDNGISWSTSISAGNVLTYDVTGLSDNTDYQFQVAATNAAGDSAWSSASNNTQTITTPSAPQTVTATAQQTAIKVDWDVPASDGGAAITGYTIRYRIQGSSDALTQIDDISSSLRTYTITNLLKDTVYDVYVYAFNAIDVDKQGAASYASATPYDTPGAPQTVDATSGNGSVTITFAPAAANGSPIVSYTITGIDTTTNTLITPITVAAPVTTITLSELTNTHKYSLTILATNAAGDGTPTTISAIPIDPTAVTIDVSTITVSNTLDAAQILESIANASSSVIMQVAKEIISQLASDASIESILNITKSLSSLLEDTALINAIATAAGESAVSSTVSTATSTASKLDDYKQRIETVKNAVIADGDTTLISLLSNIIQGATKTILNTSDTLSTKVGAALVLGSSDISGYRSVMKSATIAAVEEKSSGSTIPVSGDVLEQIKSSIASDRKTAGFDTLTSINVLVANKDTKVVMLPISGSAWYVPMMPGIEYTLGNTSGSETATFTFNAITNIMVKDGAPFTAGSEFILNNVTYPSYAIGTISGDITQQEPPAPLQPQPIEVNLNVEINANGTLSVLGYQPITPSNIVIAENLLPVDCLYDEPANIGLIEFWEPDNLDDIMAQLAITQTLGGIEGYKITAKKLALGLQYVLIGNLDATNAEPFNNIKYNNTNTPNGNRVMEGFGRLTLMAYSHYIMGHVQATAAITNDTIFMRNMLSLNNDSLLSYKYVNLDNYDSMDATWTNEGSAADANLAIRLVNTIITANPSTSLVSNGADSSVANIVKQVIGQDASRATDEDNNKYSPENHGLLRFYPDDIIYVTINLTTPSIVVGSGQLVDDATLSGLYSNATGNKKYTIKITLGEHS